MNLKFDISIEPVIFFFFLSNGLSMNGQVNLILQKLCHDGSSTNPKFCLQRSTDINTVKNMLKECLPVIPLLFAGPWRDKHGKNIPILIFVIIGQILGAAVNLLSAIFWQQIPILEAVLTEAIITGLTGSLPLLLMASACFITNRTLIQDRTFRISLILAAYLGGTTVGLVISGLILQHFGFIPLFSIAVASAVLSLFCVFIFINEKPVPSQKNLPFWLIFKTIVKKREKNVRPVIFLMIIVHCLFGSSLLCEANIFMFFLEKSLKFSVVEAGLYLSFRSIVLALSTFLTVPVLSKYFKINDIILGIISALMNCISSVWAAFSRTRLQLALCPLADLLKGGVFAVEKSIITKCVSPNELGQILSAEFVTEACCHLILLPLYTYTYNKTSDKFPGAFFFLSTIFSLIILFSFCFTKILKKEKNNVSEVEMETIVQEVAENIS